MIESDETIYKQKEDVGKVEVVPRKIGEFLKKVTDFITQIADSPAVQRRKAGKLRGTVLGKESLENFKRLPPHRLCSPLFLNPDPVSLALIYKEGIPSQEGVAAGYRVVSGTFKEKRIPELKHPFQKLMRSV